MLRKKSLVFGSVILVLGMFGYTEIYGTDWKLFKNNFQGEFFYDSENITRSSGRIVGVWVKIVYSDKFTKGENLTDLSQTVGLWEIDCQEKKMCLLSTSHYSREGEAWAPQVWLPPEWKSIPPDTIIDSLYNELCE